MACGTARFAYNWALAEWRSQYENGGRPCESELRKKLNKIKHEKYPWMLEVTKNAPQQAIKNLGLAYRYAINSVKLNKKTGRKVGFPAFKRKGVRDSFRADNGPDDANSSAVECYGKIVVLPMCGMVRMREQLRFSGRIMSATVSKSADGWYVSLLVDTSDVLVSVCDNGAVGVDLGIKALATFSNGDVVENRHPNRSLHNRIAWLSKSLSRKAKGSKNREKAKAKLSRLHMRIKNIRNDSIHKLTTKLTTEFSVVAIENLNVTGMLKNRHLSRSIADAGFGEFRRQLSYKAAMTGCEVIVVDRFYPSSKTCSACGSINKLSLAQRVFVCACGLTIDRDLNAAKNILRQALSCMPVERPALTIEKSIVKPDAEKQEFINELIIVQD